MKDSRMPLEVADKIAPQDADIFRCVCQGEFIALEYDHDDDTVSIQLWSQPYWWGWREILSVLWRIVTGQPILRWDAELSREEAKMLASHLERWARNGTETEIHSKEGDEQCHT